MAIDYKYENTLSQHIKYIATYVCELFLHKIEDAYFVPKHLFIF